MAKRSSSIKSALAGVAVFATVVVIFAVMQNGGSTPQPSGSVPEHKHGYDDSWGKLPVAAAHAEFTHVLIGWEGSSGTALKQPGRTKEQALALAVEVWKKFREDKTPENWRALQITYNEDSAAPHWVYDTSGDVAIAPSMQECAKTTGVGFARICETPWGFHLIRRER